MGNKNIKNNNQLNKPTNKQLYYQPNRIELFSNLTYDSYSYLFSVDKFTIIESTNMIYLIYSKIDKSIIIYDLINIQKISEIKNAHSKYISGLLYYEDKINKIVYLMSVSYDDNNIKLWNLKNLECLLNLNLNNIKEKGNVYKTCFLIDKNEKYFITSYGSKSHKSYFLEVFDFEGNKIKNINGSKEATTFIDIYYDNNSLTNYIITGNISYSKSYDYNKNKLYHIYKEKNYQETHSVKIIEDNGIIKLIESCGDGYIRIWNFHKGNLIKKINCFDYLNCICLWNNEYAFVGCDQKIIKLINLNNGYIIRYLNGHTNNVIDIKKINHPVYGECLISQGYENDQIKLWVNKS